MSDLRDRLDELETAAFKAMQQATRDKDETEPALRKTFYFIETIINEYEERAEE